MKYGWAAKLSESLAAHTAPVNVRRTCPPRAGHCVPRGNRYTRGVLVPALCIVPASYRIFPALGLVHVRYAGHVSLQDTRDVLGRFFQDPRRSAGMKQLIDLSEVTGFERDLASLMALQARKAEAFLPAEGARTLLVYLALTRPGLEMARQIERSWAGLDAVVVSVQTEAEAALDVLGLPRDALATLGLAAD